ncbi:MAG: DUF2232 domain-containing protein [Gammaproteobacteria bacterium]
MKALAAYILRGPIQAAGVIGLFGCIGWVFPPLLIISCASLALVVLKQDSKTGFLVMSGAVIFCAFISQVGFGSSVLAFYTVMVLWLPVLVLANVLRVTRSQSSTLVAVIIASLIFALSIRYFSNNIEEFWQQSLTQYADKIALLANAERQSEVINALSVIMNGFVAAMLGTFLMLSLLLARWWQAKLYNPGGFGEEFRKIQLPVLLTIPLFACVVIVALFKVSVPPYGFLLDVLVVGSALIMFHGLAVIHFFVQEKKLAKGWLVGVYIFLVLAAVYVFSLLTMLAVTDSFSDFRKLRAKTV